MLLRLGGVELVARRLDACAGLLGQGQTVILLLTGNLLGKILIVLVIGQKRVYVDVCNL